MIPDATTDPTDPAPRKRFPVAVVVAAMLAVLLVGGAIGARTYLRWAKQPVTRSGAAVRVTIAPGASVDAVASDLEAKRLIRSARVFSLSAKNAVIRPGLYEFAPTESVVRIISRLEKGDVVTVRVTFPEGFTAAQVAARLAKNGLCDETKFAELVTTRGNTLKATFPLPANVEGYLFPDTYRFPLGETETQIAERMVSRFETVFTTPRTDAIARSGHSLSDIVNVAAMVEREAQVPGDRPLIAAVIYNRLRRGMRLQIDATVQYARKAHKSRLLFKDLELESPYNTYRVTGLPPGAICNPGAASLNAALDPAKHDFLFYVAKSDGSHMFGKTFAEHNQNIKMVRRAR